DALPIVAGADHGRNAECAGNDGRVAGAPAAVGDNGGGAFHHRFPVGIGHVGDQHVAGLHAIHLGDVLDVAHHAGAHALADGAALDQHLLAVGVDLVALQLAAVAALHRLRARLQDVQRAGLPVLAPFDVHGPAVMALDDQRL